MKEYQYIVVGGGMAGSSAVMGIRKNDPDGSIAMFSKEKFAPYNRPPLTKSLWNGKEIDDIVRPMEKYDVDLYLSTSITKISPENNWVSTDNGEKYQYDKLLLATGGHPIKLHDSPEGVIYYRTREDYQTLRNLTNEKNDFCVIGGGFIGSEIAAALCKQDKKVTMIFPEIGISGLRFPDDLAEFLNDYYRQKGVNILNGKLVDSITQKWEQFNVKFKQVESNEVSEANFDGVIIGVGIKPNIFLAEDAGIEVDDGIVVNQYLQTNYPDIFAAGDVTYFTHFGLGEKVRVEHEDNANTMGTAAGLNMSGELEEYTHFPFFYSDLFDYGYEAVGDLDKNLEIFEDWIEPFEKGTIFYLQENKIRGLIFWNLWGKVDKGRELISEGKAFDKNKLKTLFTEE